MSPRALLLSPDDQAVSAITGVLEEMSVDCERPMDGASAAQKLNSQTYDLVLVDCDNLPAAKLIFDVCRRAHAGTPIPIAIVDGRAGLPTAFRLGAELILTKPVAKDQARTTIRTAVSRLKKEESVHPSKTDPEITAIPAAPVETKPQEPRTLAAAAGVATTPQMTAETSSAPVIQATKPAVPVIEKPITNASTTPATVTLASRAAMEPPTPLEAPRPTQKMPAPSSTKPPLALSDDLLITDFEETPSEKGSRAFSSYPPTGQQKKASGALIAALVLCLAGGGFYAAWMTQPQFREIVQPQWDKVVAYATMAMPHKSTPSVAPVHQSAKAPVVPASTALPVAAPQSAAPTQTASTPPASGSEANVQATTTSVSATASEVPAAKATTPATTSSSDDTDHAADNNAKAATSPEGELPWEKDTLILSSKGAEKRLVHQVQPTLPGGARAKRTEGTVVLKTLVSGSGAVTGVRLVEGDPTLATAATKAVKQWRYKPYMRDGNRTAFQTVVIVDFQQP